MKSKTCTVQCLLNNQLKLFMKYLKNVCKEPNSWTLKFMIYKGIFKRA